MHILVSPLLETGNFRYLFKFKCMISIGGQVNRMMFQICVRQSNSKLEEGSTPSEQHQHFRQRYAGDSLMRLGV
jgi:hypothetical protein